MVYPSGHTYEQLMINRLWLLLLCALGGMGMTMWGLVRLFRRWRHVTYGAVPQLLFLWQNLRLYHDEFSYVLAGVTVVFTLPILLMGLPFRSRWDGDWDPAADQWNGKPEPLPRWRRVAGCAWDVLVCSLVLLWLSQVSPRTDREGPPWLDPTFLDRVTLWAILIGLFCAGVALYNLYQIYLERKTMLRLEQDRRAQ